MLRRIDEINCNDKIDRHPKANNLPNILLCLVITLYNLYNRKKIKAATIIAGIYPNLPIKKVKEKLLFQSGRYFSKGSCFIKIEPRGLALEIIYLTTKL